MRGRKSRSVAVAAAALCAGTVGGLGTADGHRFNEAAEVEITSVEPSGAKGTVSSERKACVKNREVTLFRQEGDTGTRIGADTTDAEGNWSVDEPLLAGTYYAKVAAGRVSNASAAKKRKRHRHRCRSGVSKPRRG